MSFLTQGGKYKGESQAFPGALCKVLERLKTTKVSACLMEPYCAFFETFKPNQDEYPQADLKALYVFARKIKASMKWMEYLEDPIAIIM